MNELLKQNNGIDIKEFQGKGLVDPDVDQMDPSTTYPNDGLGDLAKRTEENPKLTKKEKSSDAHEKLNEASLGVQLTALADIFHDRAAVAQTPGQLFDLATDYDENGKALADLRITSVLLKNENTKPFTETDGFSPENMEKFLADAIRSMKKEQDGAVWQKFFNNEYVDSAFSNVPSFAKVKEYIKQQGEKLKETGGSNIETNETPVDTVKMVDMLMGLVKMPDNENDLIKYVDNLPSLKNFLGPNQKDFKKTIGAIKQSISKDNTKKDALEKSYDALLGKYDILVDLLGKIDTMVYGEGTDALMAKAGEKDMTPEKLIADKKSLLDLHGIIHMKDSKEFDKLIAEFSKPGKEAQVITIVKAYLLKANPDLLKRVFTISVGEEEIVQDSGKLAKRPVFKLYDESGKELEGSVAFGITVEKTGNDGKKYVDYPAATMDNVLNLKSFPSWAKELFKFEKVNASDSKEPGNEASENRDGNLPTGPLDALSLLLNSKTVRELKIFFLSAFGTNNNEGTEIQINYLTSLNAVEDSRKKFTPEQKKQYGYEGKAKDGGVSRLMGKMNNVAFATAGGKGPKKDQTTALYPGSQQHFYTEVLLPEEKIQYALDIPSGTREALQKGTNVATTSFDEFSKSKGDVKLPEQAVVDIPPTLEAKKKPEGIVFNGRSAEVPELKNAQFTGKVEIEMHDDKEYLLVEISDERSQMAALYQDVGGKSIGYIEVPDANGKKITKKITIATSTETPPVRTIEFESITLSADDTVAFGKVFGGDVCNISGLMNIKDKPGVIPTFLSKTLKFPDPTQVTPEMQGLVAKAQSSLLNLKSIDITSKSIKDIIGDDASGLKKSLVEEAGKIPNTDKGPTKETATAAVVNLIKQFDFISVAPVAPDKKPVIPVKTEVATGTTERSEKY